jgi:hypothetical protein
MPVNGDDDGTTAPKRKRSPDEDVSFESLVSPDFEELSRRFPDFGRAYKDVKQAQSASGVHWHRT